MPHTRSTYRSSIVTALVLSSLFLTACSSGAAPTPTPTKTTVPAGAQPTPPPPTATAPPPVVALATPTPVAVDTPTPQPGNIAPFTGIAVDDPARLKQAPIFICVNNDPVGRSAHWGLSQADLVYEYIVDGFSMTRLTAVYHSKDAERVGPVRSARYPNIWMVQMYGGVLACSGGSDAIRYLLKNEAGFPYLDADVDDPSNNRYFTSLGSDYRTRMQARTAGVRQWLLDNRDALQASFAGRGLDIATYIDNWSKPGFPYAAEAPGGDAGAGAVVDIPYPGGNSVEWRYDPALGGYVRSQGGEPQFDPATNQPIMAANVVVLSAVHELTDIVEDSLGTKGVNIKLHEFGDLRVFRDGKVYEGTWRASQESPPRWLGAGEAPIPLKPGQSWIQVVQDIKDVTYQ